MHPGERSISTDQARRLIESQFPRWANLPIERVRSAGTDNALFRIGTELVARFPRVEWSSGQPAKEHRWLPVLSPHLPLEIPTVLALGQPGHGYPWNWSVHRWIDGENATLDRLSDPRKAAIELATFVRVLRSIDTTDGPLAGPHNFGRGVPLAQRDDMTRKAIAQLVEQGDELNARELAGRWDESLATPAWDRSPVWVHGDLQPGNLLTVDGRLRAVIDFGGLGVGDPAVDLIVAWHLLDAESRSAFREHSDVDHATWKRGRGWALSVSLVALPYYRETNRTLAQMSRNTIEQVLAHRG